jgi:GNAT superfamily N-acetyltransferase
LAGTNSRNLGDRKPPSPGPARLERIDVPAGKIASIVTSLEMLARPSERREINQHGLQLHVASSAALDWYREVYRRVGSDWLWFSRLQLSDDALSRILSDPQVEVYAARRGAEDAGLLELDFREAGICELAFFGLLPSYVGSGAGRWLMNRALEIAWSRPISRFWVHTCTHDHPDALRFYMRSGFRPFQQYVEIADDPRIVGTLPRNAASHVPVLEAPALPLK